MIYAMKSAVRTLLTAAALTVAVPLAAQPDGQLLSLDEAITAALTDNPAMKAAAYEEKAAVLYDFLDQSKLFKGTVVEKDRSLMNVPFVTGNEELDAKFVKEAKEAGFENLKGHRTVGGMRASIYNAMPIEGVEKLVEFMKDFEAKNL